MTSPPNAERPLTPDEELRLLLAKPGALDRLTKMLKKTSASVSIENGVRRVTRPIRPGPGEIRLCPDGHPDFVQIVSHSCKTCGKKFHTYAHMVWMPDSRAYVLGWTYSAESEVPDGVDCKISHHTVTVCNGCESWLLALSKEELVRIIIAARTHDVHCSTTAKEIERWREKDRERVDKQMQEISLEQLVEDEQEQEQEQEKNYREED